MDVCHSLVQGTVSGFGTDDCHSLFQHIPGSGKDSCQGLFHHNIPTYICKDIQCILETRNSQNQTSGTLGFRERFPHKNFLNINFKHRVRYQVFIAVTARIDKISWDVTPQSPKQMFKQEPVPSWQKNTDDGGSRFLWNISTPLPDYTVSHPRHRKPKKK